MTDANAVSLEAINGKVVERVWNDSSFKAKLLADPHAALAELGFAIPAGVTIKTVEDTDTLLHLVLRSAPTLSDEDLKKVAGGLLPAIGPLSTAP